MTVIMSMKMGNMSFLMKMLRKLTQNGLIALKEMTVSKVVGHIATRGHRCLILPKFHCELNPIERVWCRAKLYARNQCDYTFQHLRRTVQPALDSVTTDDVRKYFRTFRDYKESYKQKLGVVEAEEEVKTHKSHCRIFSPNS